MKRTASTSNEQRIVFNKLVFFSNHGKSKSEIQGFHGKVQPAHRIKQEHLARQCFKPSLRLLMQRIRQGTLQRAVDHDSPDFGGAEPFVLCGLCTAPFPDEERRIQAAPRGISFRCPSSIFSSWSFRFALSKPPFRLSFYSGSLGKF